MTTEHRLPGGEYPVPEDDLARGRAGWRRVTGRRQNAERRIGRRRRNPVFVLGPAAVDDELTEVADELLRQRDLCRRLGGIRCNRCGQVVGEEALYVDETFAVARPVLWRRRRRPVGRPQIVAHFSVRLPRRRRRTCSDVTRLPATSGAVQLTHVLDGHLQNFRLLHLRRHARRLNRHKRGNFYQFDCYRKQNWSYAYKLCRALSTDLVEISPKLSFHVFMGPITVHHGVAQPRSVAITCSRRP